MQPTKGYRFGIDAIILAAHVSDARAKGRVLDIGTGVGIIALLLANCMQNQDVTGVELQEELFEFAKKNAQFNHLQGKTDFIQGDFNAYKALFRPQSFDTIVSNPPFYPIGNGRLNPDSAKAIARHEVSLKLDTVMMGIRYLLKPGGRAFLIYPATGMTRFFAAMTGAGLGLAGLRTVHPAGSRPAALFVAEISTTAAPETRVEPAWEIPVVGRRVPRVAIEILEACNED